ncbi:CDP-alcohol phosphatidyltransferase family protein [Olivibacter sp. XZL3]|uniref:CDP-alcohol phosphatidyltransferase family protein n=1 Tax=Olivibacter sp. XZL3 TaxID=1735116 RepID=UPI0010654DBA|nr:CDP-alcohol phosphatidyltransferase family protein [Olivibacter sp. XZL3]
MRKKSYYWINGITLYRLIAAPFLLFLIFSEHINWFKWLLAFSFFTDAIDGFLARKYKVASVMGAKMDSLADDLTVLVAIVGLFFYHQAFIYQEYRWVLLLLILFLIQITCALVRYGKFTSFHTYLAKVAAVSQALFLIPSFFLPSPSLPLFYIAIVLTSLDLIEETMMVMLLPKWEADVKGLHEVIHKRNKNKVG